MVLWWMESGDLIPPVDSAELFYMGLVLNVNNPYWCKWLLKSS